jgi:hypothetical protein
MKEFLKKAFPFLATAAGSVGGPLGAAAAATLGNALGLTKKDPSIDDLAVAYTNATPDQLLAAQKEEHDYAAKMRAMGLENEKDLEKIAADDRASARAREVSLRDKFVPVLATVLIVSFVVAVLAVIRGWGKVEAAFAGTLIGYLAANANQVVSYYFGSSAGSARKTELMKGGE